MDDLTPLEKRMLEFEQLWWGHAGSKMREIRERFDMSATQYYQRLNALIDEPAALAFSPITVRQLQHHRRHDGPGYRGA